MKIPFFYLKDKQAFSMKTGAMRLIGQPIALCKELQKQGIKLVHIIDLDAKRGMGTNFDMYNHLTYLINIQVEAGIKIEFIEKLLKVKARVVFDLPTKVNLTKLKEYERLLVGKIAEDSKTTEVHDVILENADNIKVKKYKNKRIIVSEQDYGKLDAGNRKLIWGILTALSARI